MGWMIVFAINDLLANTPEISLLYLLLGGISYSVGVVFYLLKKVPYSHGIWHLFVLGGSIFHFLCVYSFLV
jgi:hemolysin III